MLPKLGQPPVPFDPSESNHRLGKQVLFFRHGNDICQALIKEIIRRNIRSAFVFIDIDRYPAPHFVNTVPYIINEYAKPISMLQVPAFLTYLQNRNQNSLAPPLPVERPPPVEPVKDVRMLNQLPDGLCNDNIMPVRGSGDELGSRTFPNSYQAALPSSGTSANPYFDEMEFSAPPPRSMPAPSPKPIAPPIGLPQQMQQPDIMPCPWTIKVQKSSKINESDYQRFVIERENELRQVTANLRPAAWL